MLSELCIRVEWRSAQVPPSPAGGPPVNAHAAGSAGVVVPSTCRSRSRRSWTGLSWSQPLEGLAGSLDYVRFNEAPQLVVRPGCNW